MSDNARMTPNRTHSSIGLAAIWSAVCGALATFAVLLAVSGLYCATDVPDYMCAPLATLAICAGAFMSARQLAKRIGQNGLLWGLGCGMVFFVLFAAAALLNGQTEFTAFALIKLACMLLSGALGGYLGIVSSEKKRQRKPR